MLDRSISFLGTVGVWSETEGGSDAAVHCAYGLEYSWAAGNDGTLEVTVASTSEEAEGESMRRNKVTEGVQGGSYAITSDMEELCTQSSYL